MKWVRETSMLDDKQKLRIPIMSWCEEPDPTALKQAYDLVNLPFTHHHVALMPDCHAGKGMPIGGVIACKDAIIPNAVGVDIGCGMGAIKTSHKGEVTEEQIKEMIGAMRREIPVGFDHRDEALNWDGFDEAPDTPPVQQQLRAARKQLGTLGGGNHFIEIQRGSDGHIWLMVHSGSRNFGYQIAKYYNDLAQKRCTMWHSKVQAKGDDGLAFLPIGTKEAGEYIESMKFALKFAEENRQVMLSTFETVAAIVLKCLPEHRINIHHNFANLENHYGKNVWVHRKGATQAKAGQFGIIPGSMGTSSYIVVGRGCPTSFESCSHGAGRTMGRKEFCRTHTVEECTKAMEGIVFGRWSKDRKGNWDISEAPQAYKDIEDVIDSERDLVDVVVKLKPLGVMKG